MSVRKMLERTAEARRCFEQKLDHLNAVRARPVESGENGLSPAETFVALVEADLVRAAEDVASVEALSTPTPVDSGTLYPRLRGPSL